jgi:hypothetical protein
MGNGRYSQKLTEDEWVKFNNHQRVHYNYIEHLPIVISLQARALPPAAVCHADLPSRSYCRHSSSRWSLRPLALSTSSGVLSTATSIATTVRVCLCVSVCV